MSPERPLDGARWSFGAFGHPDSVSIAEQGDQSKALASPSGVYTKREHKQSSEDLKCVADEWLAEFERHAASTALV